jgi:putative hemolysin
VDLFETALVAFLAVASGFLSASELALFSLNRFQIRALKDQFPPIHKRVKRLLADPGGVLVTILVLNELLNIAISTVITGIVSGSRIPDVVERITGAPSWLVDLGTGTLLTFPIVLFFCDMTPKVIGTRANLLVTGLSSPVLSIIYDIMKPVRAVIGSVIRGARRLSGDDTTPTDENLLKRSDFLVMLEEGHKEGTIQETELELVKKVFEFDQTPAREIMTPLIQVQTLPENTSIRGALNTLQYRQHSRVPVIRSTITGRKEVRGILYTKDLLKAKLSLEMQAQPISALMRKPLFVEEDTHLNVLFRRLKQQRLHMAIVQNEGGIATGIVTMNDALAALFEDAFNEEEEGGRT